MNQEEILEKLSEAYVIVNETEVPEDFTMETDLRTDIGLSSVGMLYFVIVIENLFDMKFEGVGVEDFKTIGDVVRFIEKNVAI